MNIKSIISEDFEGTVSILGLFFSFFFLLFFLITGKSPLYLTTVILTFLSILIWIITKKNRPNLFFDIKSRRLIIIFYIFFVLLFLSSILIIFLRDSLYERPLGYFFIISSLAGLIGCQIIVSEKKDGIPILIQIILLGINISWSQLVIFSGIIGVDPWYHQWLTTSISYSGYIPVGEAYSNLAFFHLLISSSSILLNIHYKFAAMLTVSLLQIILIPIIIFILSMKLFEDNRKIALLSSLFAIIANHQIFMSFWSIPNAFAVLYVIIIIYLIFSLRTGIETKFTLLIFILMFSLILTHTITSFFLCLLLFTIYFINFFHNSLFKQKIFNIGSYLPFLFIIIMIGWWGYASGSIYNILKLFSWGFSRDYFIRYPKEYLNFIQSDYLLPELLFNNIGFFLFFSLAFIGLLYMISKDNSKLCFSYAIIAIIPLFAGYFSLISNLSLIDHRWWYFAQIFLSIPLSLSILYIIKIINFKYNYSRFILLFSIISIFCFLLIVTPIANIDNHKFSPNTGVRYSLKNSEITGAKFFSTYSSGNIASDFDYCSNSSSNIFVHYYNFPNSRINSLDESLFFGEFNKNYKDTIIIRDEIINSPFRLAGTTFKLEYNPKNVLNKLFSKIYSNEQVTGYN